MEALILQFINYVLERNVFLAYVVFLFSAFLQILFPPHPGDVLLVFQGYLTTVSHSFGIIPIFLISLAGTFLSSFVVYKIGYYKGDKVFEYKLVSRFVKLQHREKARQLFEKYGAFAIFIGKYIPGLSAVMILSSGVFKVKARIAYTSIIASIILHDIICLLLGRVLGNNLESVKKIFSTYNSVVISLVLLAAASFGAYKLILNKIHKRKML